MAASENVFIHTHTQLIRLWREKKVQKKKQVNAFPLSVSLMVCVAPALCFFKVPTLYVSLYLCAQFVSASLSPYQLLSTLARSLSPSLALCYFISLPLYVSLSLSPSLTPCLFLHYLCGLAHL